MVFWALGLACSAYFFVEQARGRPHAAATAAARSVRAAQGQGYSWVASAATYACRTDVQNRSLSPHLVREAAAPC